MNRRTFLRAGPPVLGLSLAGETGGAPESPRRRCFRAAHLTDIHLRTDRDAPARFAAALRLVQGLADPPDLLLFGGDCINDALGATRESTLEQWSLWREVLAAELRLPARACLGNHDLFGWGRRTEPGVAEDPLYGKAHARQCLGLPADYYSFDHAGWHVVMLDSNHDGAPDRTYVARLDEAQFAWLERDLAATPPETPVAVLSHIPILSAAAFFDGDNATTGHWVVPGEWMHLDAARLKGLFLRHPNVKVCLSGHLHLVDDVTYLGVRYLCNGAVCGGWWKGSYQEFPQACALLDFFADGTVKRRMLELPAGPA